MSMHGSGLWESKTVASICFHRSMYVVVGTWQADPGIYHFLAFCLAIQHAQPKGQTQLTHPLSQPRQSTVDSRHRYRDQASWVIIFHFWKITWTESIQIKGYQWLSAVLSMVHCYVRAHLVGFLYCMSNSSTSSIGFIFLHSISPKVLGLSPSM